LSWKDLFLLPFLACRFLRLLLAHWKQTLVNLHVRNMHRKQLALIIPVDKGHFFVLKIFVDSLIVMVMVIIFYLFRCPSFDVNTLRNTCAELFSLVVDMCHSLTYACWLGWIYF
jgi:hypothetical protein